MAKQVFLSVLLTLCILKVCVGYYWYWYTTERMKSKILYMSRELIKDAIRNYQRVDHIKEYYSSSAVWDIGQMLYFIRSKYARMVRVYVLSIENNNKFKNFHLHLPALKEIHHLGMDIYNLVEMLEEYDVTVEEPSMIQAKMLKKMEAKKALNASIINAMNIPPNANIQDIAKKHKSLRKRLINIPSLANQNFYARKPIRALRNRMKANRQRNIDAAFDSDIE